MAKATKKAEVRTAVKNINLNKVNVTGRLTANTEVLKLKEKNRYVCKGSIAINRTYKGEEYVSFIDFEMFTDAPLELKKGQKVYLEGRIVSDEWKNENGDYRSKTKIQAFHIIPTEMSGNDMNTIIVSGRLVKDPVIATVKENRSVVKFRLAVNRNYQVDNEWKQITEYVDVAHFGTTEYLAKLVAHLSKGRFVYITGSLLQEKWQNKSGENRTKVSVIAETINLSYVNSKKNEESAEQTAKKTKKEDPIVDDIENEIEDIEDIETPF